MAHQTLNRIKSDCGDRPDFRITFIMQQGQISIQTELPDPSQPSGTVSAKTYVQWFIGRSDRCSIVINDSTISRQHAVLGYDADTGFYIIDTKSHNGTFLNQKRLLPLKRYALQTNDRITLSQQPIQITILYKDPTVHS
jgi:pSer/pThr/pTyr-binding forkhead associated (FHA) protein